MVEGIKASPSLYSEQRQQQLEYFQQHRKPLSEESKEKIRQARLRQKFPTKMTSIERLLFDEFTKEGLKFEMHKTMFGRWQPDFIFEDVFLIVQADGDYWHSLPEAIEKDARFDDAATEAGWTVWRLAEKHIKAQPSVLGQAVARFVRSTKEGLLNKE